MCFPREPVDEFFETVHRCPLYTAVGSGYNGLRAPRSNSIMALLSADYLISPPAKRIGLFGARRRLVGKVRAKHYRPSLQDLYPSGKVVEVGSDTPNGYARMITQCASLV